MSKEIIDKINNNLIMLVEGFDDAERDYGYDMANEKHYVSELIELVKNLSLSGISQQREQLLDFWMKLPKTHKHKGVAEHYIDNYLKSNNCG